MDKVGINRRVASNPQQYPPSIIMTFNQVSSGQAMEGSLQCRVTVTGIAEDVEHSFNFALASRPENPQERYPGKQFKTPLGSVRDKVQCYIGYSLCSFRNLFWEQCILYFLEYKPPSNRSPPQIETAGAPRSSEIEVALE